jgi:flagellar protein FliJ
MTKWIKPLIRLSTYEVETLQKRLSEVVTLRTHMEMKIATLDAQLELEGLKAASDYSLAQLLNAYKQGHALRRDQALQELEVISAQEDGIRDALAYAFEDLKKFEHLAQKTKIKRLAALAKQENAALDEVALRMSQA